MQDPTFAHAWVRFAGIVLVVAVLYWAQALLVPIALALLLTFVLSPIVAPLQRRVGGVAAVLLVVAVTFSGLGLAGWAITSQLGSLAQQLPAYQQNVRQKIRDVRWLGKGGSVAALQETVNDIQSELEQTEKGSTAKPVVVESAPIASLWGLPTAVGGWLEPLATAGLVLAFVIFMLLERQDLRNRFISLVGQGHLAVTTRAIDEAGQRVSRYLIAQSLINMFYGLAVGVGLFVIGVPYATLWAALAAVLRFVPYIGPWIAAAAPTLVSLAAFDGWTRPLEVVALYGALELFTNLVVEGFFYAGVAGVSQVGLMVAFAFWTWLWGPLGLLMATPLTVCLVVMSKYVPGFEFIATLLADTTVLESHVSYYQRLLAGDQAEAAELIEHHLQHESAETLYDALVIPALNYAERDRIDGRLSPEEELALVNGSRTLLEESSALLVDASGAFGNAAVPAEGSVLVLGWPVHGDPDALALEMLRALLKDTPVTIEILAEPALLARGVLALAERAHTVVCIADLPPSAPSKARYLVKRLRALRPELKILVGRWAPPAFADDSRAILLAAGADAVATTLVEMREQLAAITLEAAPSGATLPPETRAAAL